MARRLGDEFDQLVSTIIDCNTMQHTATTLQQHCNTLQHTATHCNTLKPMFVDLETS